MNGIEALENWYNTEHPKPVEYCFHYNIIKKELKILQILKEKRVDLRFIAYNKEYFEIKELTLEYNSVLFGNTKLKLTEEEMALIVDWLKEE